MFHYALPEFRFPGKKGRRWLVALLLFLVHATIAYGQTSFDEELQKVRPDAQFERILDETYTEDEWSVEGLTIRGGSESALNRGTSEALYAMGFRFYSPMWFHYPDAVQPVQIEKRTSKVTHLSIWLSYGHDRKSEAGRRLSENFKRWQVLNDVGNPNWPAGHTWHRIITSNSKLYEAQPELLRGPRTFELDDPEAYRRNVEICADYLAENLNEFGRHSFDPSDGDTYPSDKIYKFSLDVLAEIRKTRPDASLGIYAYAGHRLPPDFDLPGLYVQVALAFNKTSFSYSDLVRRYADIADQVMLREYFDVEAWYLSQPAGNLRNQRDYYEKNYPAFFDAGVKVVNGEFNGNWLANVVSINYAMRYLKDGKADYEHVLDEVVRNLFSGDPAVKRLYWLWSEPGSEFDWKTTQKSFEIVSQMKEGWYSEAFRRYLTIGYKTLDLGSKINPFNFNYKAKLEDVLSNVKAIEETGWVHAYAYFRRLANGNVRFDYPDLWMMADQPPEWMNEPVMPSDKEFEDQLRTLSD